jgi:hypothetical protein
MPHNWHDIAGFTKGWENYYDDRFAFRTNIVSLKNLLTLKAFGDAGNSQVIARNDGWMDYVPNGDLIAYVNQRPLSPEELQMIGQELEDRRAWLAKRGIRFLFVLAPQKSTIYPDRFPSLRRRTSGEKREEQLIKYLRDHTAVATIDLRQALTAASKKGLVYYKTDTHWNLAGADVVNHVIVTALREWFPQIPQPTNVAFQERPFFGSLSQIAGLQPWLTETSPAIDWTKTPPLWHATSRLPLSKETWFGKDTPIVVTETANHNLPSAVLLDDSFLNLQYQPFLPENFRRCVSIKTSQFPMRLIAEEKPDVVIDEEVEWALTHFLPLTTPGLHEASSAQP